MTRWSGLSAATLGDGSAPSPSSVFAGMVPQACVALLLLKCMYSRYYVLADEGPAFYEGSENEELLPLLDEDAPAEKTCGLPPPMEHGTVLELHETRLTTFPLGFQVTYVCYEGYRIFTGRRRSRCGRNGWSGKTPRCEIVECPDPGAPENGYKLATNYRVGSKVSFDCYPGYELLGSSELQCLARGQWLGEPARCNAPGNYCPDPGVPIGGSKNTTEYGRGDRVGFRCLSGRILVGSEVRECLPNRTWSGFETTCIGLDEFDNELQVADMLRVKELREEHRKRFPVLQSSHHWSRNISSSNSTGWLDTSNPERTIIYFVFDVSGSIGPHSFEKGIAFAKTVVRKVGISEDGARAGALTFSTRATPVFLPIQYKSTEAVLTALDKIEFEGGRGSNVNSALREVREGTMPLMKHFLGEEGTKSVVFLLTDGKVNMGGDPRREADILKAEGVDIFCIGLTDDVRKRTLHQITSSLRYGEETPQSVYVLREYESSEWIVQEITKGAEDFSACGRQPNHASSRRPRVIGGRVSVGVAWPWMAALYTTSAPHPGMVCGGSIIHQYFVLTAAQCLYKYHNTQRQPAEITVKMGLTSMRNTTFLREFDVRKIHVHPFYVHGWSRNFDYDIALLELERPIVYSPYIRPVCLPPREIPEVSHLYKPDSVAWVTGWGSALKSRQRLEGIQELMEAVLPIQSSETCIDSLRDENFTQHFTGRMFCAGGGGSDTCHGDSGGPLMQSQLNNWGHTVWTQVGITSWGSPECARPGQYTFFSHLQVLRPWVDRTIENSVKGTEN